MKQLITAALLCLATTNIFALCFPTPKTGDNVIGHLQTVIVEPGDNFYKIAERYDVGYYELKAANPGINPDVLPINTGLLIPTRFILPDASHKGIVVNLAEFRLYTFPASKPDEVCTYPLGIGRADPQWQTPQGKMKIIEKRKDPTWYVPESIRKARAEEGIKLPDKIPPGPDNPLGPYALRLSKPSYLIHGTNKAYAVGMRSSAGCLRMYNKDITQLYEMTNVGAAVNIINEPYKIGWQANNIYLEAHLPLKESEDVNIPQSVDQLLQSVLVSRGGHVSWKRAMQITEEERGIPGRIGNVG